MAHRSTEFAHDDPTGSHAVLDFFRARAVAGVEAVAGSTYRRTLAVGRGPALVELTVTDRGVVCRASAPDGAGAAEAIERCRCALDVDADGAHRCAHLAHDPILAPLIRRRPRMRLPGSFDPQETALRAVLGQQVSVAGARTLAQRLVARCGAPLPGPTGGLTHTFPSAAAIAGADLSGLGMPEARLRALEGLAAALAEGAVALGPRVDATATHAALVALPGIGPWTASYICMRACGDRDAFPASDLGVIRGAAALGLPTDRRALAEVAERWRPYRAYAVMHLWSAAPG